MFDGYKDVEHPERCSNDDTKVTGQYGRGMIANKDRPAMIATWVSPCLRRKSFSAASALCGCRKSQRNVARSRRSVIIVLTPCIMGGYVAIS